MAGALEGINYNVKKLGKNIKVIGIVIGNHVKEVESNEAK